ncbi:MAG: nuclear transport factor 2 family protein [Beijerinckiaceae bacterium]|nr:nuclear transport factor 2 family protein [Beijerinckiaceae bacterium]
MSSSPAEEIVARQLLAYNRRDIEAFMACWHEDAQMLVHPAGVLADGAAEIRARHEKRFEEPDLFARLTGRFSVGNMVVDREIVVRTFPAGRGEIDVIAIYEISGDRIAKAWFRSGEPRFVARD